MQELQEIAMFLLYKRMIKNPKISIITVCCNSQSTIKHTIESVSSQDYPNVEYIVIDGASTDWTLKVLNYCQDKINYFISENDEGIYDAMNKGIKMATGDIIGILNSDDFYPNNNVLSKVAKMFSVSDCDCLYGDLVYVNKSDGRQVVRYWKSGEFSVSKLDKGWMLPHPTFFVKKNVYEKYGLYNTDLKTAADYEMILRLLHKYRLKVVYLPEIMVKMRMGGESNKSFWNRIKANKEDSLAWTKNQLNKPMFVRFKKPLQKLKQFFLKPEI
ncbi:MAG: glycosyltransferase family 2 protein [Bacteroidota bacterium]|nr:glycosyltransferase family 2 protein [Bacteroidota bacterium]